MPAGCVYTHSFYGVFVSAALRIGILWKYALIHIGVGFCVARSTIPGNARASVCGTSNGSTPTLFYAATPINLTPTAFSGARGIKTYCNMLNVNFEILFPRGKLVTFDDVVKNIRINIKETVIRNTHFGTS